MAVAIVGNYLSDLYDQARREGLTRGRQRWSLDTLSKTLGNGDPKQIEDLLLLVADCCAIEVGLLRPKDALLHIFRRNQDDDMELLFALTRRPGLAHCPRQEFQQAIDQCITLEDLIREMSQLENKPGPRTS